MRRWVVLVCAIVSAACSRGPSLVPTEQAPAVSLAIRPNVAHVVPFFSFRGGPFGSTSVGAGGGQGFGGVIGDPQKAVFGVTAQGGDALCKTPASGSGLGGCGLVYAIVPSGPTARKEKVLHVFHGGDGEFPEASLTQGPDGVLYGTTYLGGKHNFGTVFSLVPKASGYTYHVLYSFQGKSDGGLPSAPVLLGSNGVIFGTTITYGTGSQGTVFELVPSGSKYIEKVLFAFSGGSLGGSPMSGLTATAQGVLIGAAEGGTNHFGVIYALTPSASSASGYSGSLIHTFSGTDGNYPTGGHLILGPDGSIYGTTQSGGDGAGVVYRLTHATSGYVEETLHSFSRAAFSEGLHPYNGVALRRGVLYGTTSEGGLRVTCDGAVPYFQPRDGCGTLFSVTTSGKAFSTIHVFHGRMDGGLPWSQVVLAPDGSILGTTLIGGTKGFGTIYQAKFH